MARHAAATSGERGWARFRKRKEVRRSVSGLTFRPDLAAMSAHDSSRSSQTDPVAFKLLRAVQPLKDAEQPRARRRIKTHPVVADKDDIVSVDRVIPELDQSRITRTRVLHRVRK